MFKSKQMFVKNVEIFFAKKTLCQNEYKTSKNQLKKLVFLSFFTSQKIFGKNVKNLQQKVLKTACINVFNKNEKKRKKTKKMAKNVEKKERL